jgi:hypothetical protein
MLCSELIGQPAYVVGHSPSRGDPDAVLLDLDHVDGMPNFV